ncbi:MAG TPA: HIT domain-containing protein [Actinomycetes bacterium]|nr:HIT domain-containing protein [Actinomycetes bacterium]
MCSAGSWPGGRRRTGCSRTSTRWRSLNIAPATVGHALVVPRRHADGLWDLEDEEHAHLARAASRVARRLRRALDPAG